MVIGIKAAAIKNRLSNAFGGFNLKSKLRKSASRESSDPPTPGSRESSQPPTPGSQELNQPPLPGSREASQPSTPGSQEGSQPPTPGSRESSQPSTPTGSRPLLPVLQQDELGFPLAIFTKVNYLLF